jgi:hypothetical protein
MIGLPWTSMRAAILALVMLWGGLARADSEVDRLFVEGRDLMKKGEYQAACDRFHAANALDTLAPSVMLNLGLCYEQLGKLATSLRWYRKAQTAASEAKPPIVEFEDAAKEKKRALAPRVATIKFDAAGLQPQATVFVDGEQFRREDLIAPLELDRGAHVVEVSATGLVAYKTSIEIVDGEARTLALPALALPAAPPPPPPRSRRGLGLAIGVPSAVLVVGLPIGAWRLQQHFNDTRSPSNTKTIMRVMGAGWVAGVAGAVVGGYFVLKRPKAERRTALAPVVSPDQVGAVLVHSF